MLVEVLNVYPLVHLFLYLHLIIVKKGFIHCLNLLGIDTRCHQLCVLCIRLNTVLLERIFQVKSIHLMQRKLGFRMPIAHHVYPFFIFKLFVDGSLQLDLILVLAWIKRVDKVVLGQLGLGTHNLMKRRVARCHHKLWSGQVLRL